MSEALREWLEKELRDFEPVCKSFRSKQRRMYYIWMAVAVAGMVALGFGVGYDWTYVLRVHLPIGVGIAVFIWLCVLLTSRAGSIKTARKSFEKALSALSPSDQEAITRQDFGRVDFLNTFEDSFPARLLVGPDFWLYFRNVCQVYRVADMEKLQAREEKTQLRYTVGSTRVRQKVGVGVSLVVDYREDTGSAKGRPDQLYLASWEQFQTARDLIARHCPKAENLWKKK
ncbi:MAG: hypothetical protein HDT14_06840 [Oscillibacter sp.]|nr:hypothetical protein [Oscillibacter sp.]